MAAVWDYDPGVVWSEKTLVSATFGPLLESWGLLTFGGEGLPSQVYGKGFVLVYLLMVLVFRTINDAHLQTGRAGAFERWTWRGMYGALLVAMTRDAFSYWGVALPGDIGEIL